MSEQFLIHSNLKKGLDLVSICFKRNESFSIKAVEDINMHRRKLIPEERIQCTFRLIGVTVPPQ